MPTPQLKLAVLALPLIAAAAPAQAAYRIELAGPPPGFEELERPRDLVVDVYFGGTKVGETRLIAKPGEVTFRDADQVLGFVPSVRNSPALSRLFASGLPTNSHLACSQTSDRCGKLAPEIAGVIFDEERFRVDLFIHPNHLETIRATEALYLRSTGGLSLTSSAGLALSGSGGASPTYNFQNRTIVGFGNARLRSDSSFASGLGLAFDDLAAEIDTDHRRYSAGLFWAPGLDLTGRRRIVGIGLGTQFDTRSDRDSLSGTPLVTFLAQPARIEVLIDGRLVTSGAYQPGNNVVDTSSLPDGSYSLVLRVREAGGSTREERRFFVKNRQVAPIGEPIYFAYAGLLANTERNRPISLSKSIFYQAGAARRLSESVALDAALLGTEKKTIAEAGAWLLTRHARVRGAALVSSAGDYGALLQLGSAGQGRLNFNFDVRRVWSGDGRPLIPLPSHVDNFGSIAPTGAQLANGSYTQASGSISYSLGVGYASLTGSYRRDRGSTADYSIGPSLTWPLVNRNGVQLVLQADAQRTQTSTATFLGFRALFTSGRFSAFNSSGRGSIRSRDNSSRSRKKAVGSMSAQWFYQDEDRTQASVGVGYDRNLNSTTANLNATVNGRFGSLRGDVLRNIAEAQSGLQYGLTFQSGLAIVGDKVSLGGRDLNDSAVIASIGGSARDMFFEVLVNEVPRGRISSGGRLPIFLEAYRNYKVRLKPIGSVPASYDSDTHELTLFPGNVKHLQWNADALITLFGRAVRADGTPVANAMVQSRHGIGQTDQNGYFQVDAVDRDVLELTNAGASACKIPLNPLQAPGDYASIGRVVCK